MAKIYGLKFGDIIINHCASENNPRRRGIFVKYHRRTIEVTDGNGNFWKTYNDSESEIEIEKGENIFAQLRDDRKRLIEAVDLSIHSSCPEGWERSSPCGDYPCFQCWTEWLQENFPADAEMPNVQGAY